MAIIRTQIEHKENGKLRIITNDKKIEKKLDELCEKYPNEYRLEIDRIIESPWLFKFYEVAKGIDISEIIK